MNTQDCIIRPLNRQLIACVYHPWIHSLSQPVLSNEGKSFLLKETTGAFDGALTNCLLKRREKEPTEMGDHTYLNISI